MFRVEKCLFNDYVNQVQHVANDTRTPSLTCLTDCHKNTEESLNKAAKSEIFDVSSNCAKTVLVRFIFGQQHIIHLN